MKLKSPHLIKPHTKVRLARISSSDHDGFRDKDAADATVAKHIQQLDNLQQAFYASQKKALLIVLQGMDTAGKDGTIRHIFSGINPQGCDVSSFKVPTPLEARHDFLWRCQAATPARGMIGIFNRSHYEDVLSPWVHGQLDATAVRQRIRDINAWEQTLANEDVVILKFYLSTSPATSRPSACNPASTPPTSAGSSPPPTSKSASSGPNTSRPTTKSFATPAPTTPPGSSSRPITSGIATRPSPPSSSTPCVA
jgi:polyphosphate kinase 2 (PPK2 family)